MSVSLKTRYPRIERVDAPGTTTERFSGGYVLGKQLFREALLRERRRSDRQGATFAVVVVDRTAQPTPPPTWAMLLDAAMQARGDADAVGWLKPGSVLGIIVPEATREVVDGVVSRLHQQIAARLGAAAGTVSIRRYTHGPNAAGLGANLPPADLLVTNFQALPRMSRRHEVAKRALDLIGSLALLALFAPVIAAACLAVKCSSRGPIFFRQVRVGRRGEPFEMLKFRSMRTDMSSAAHQEYVTWFITQSGKQERTGTEVYKLTVDPRITRVGQWLRKTSLDELPQFINVLRGDMSLVGPRPPLPFEVAQYQPWHRRRVLDAKPGVTGLWQVRGRSRTTFDEMVRMDLDYVRTRTLWTDIRILAATPVAMVKGAL